MSSTTFFRLNFYGKDTTVENTAIQTFLAPSAGANVNTKDSNGNTALQNVITDAGALQAVGKNPDSELPVVNELLADGATVTTSTVTQAQNEGANDIAATLQAQQDNSLTSTTTWNATTFLKLVYRLGQPGK